MVRPHAGDRWLRRGRGTGANIFFVLDGVLHTPRTRDILVGVSRQYVIALAVELGITVVEGDLTLYDAYNAEEAFWTTSSYLLYLTCFHDRWTEGW